jgi:acetyl-CoA synthetase
MSELYPVPADFAAQANVSAEQYESMYAQSIENPEEFWAEQAKKYISWSKPWNSVMDWDFGKNPSIKWFEGATLNVSYNCLDRHLETRGDQTAIIWESDDPNEHRTITYTELHEEVCKFANVLKKRGVKKGDRVSILYANGSRSRRCHVGLHTHRCRAFYRFRWILPRGFTQSNSRF